MQSFAPGFLIGPLWLAAPKLAQQFIAATYGLLLLQNTQEFQGGTTIIQRRDEWLLQGYCAIERSGIAP